MKHDLSRLLNIEHYAREILEIIDNAEEIICDPGETGYDKKCARMNAYDAIVELIDGRREDG